MRDEVKELKARMVVFSVIMTVALLGAVLVALYVLDNTDLAIWLGVGICIVESMVLGKMVKKIKELEGDA